jgi:hypothetical protein
MIITRLNGGLGNQMFQYAAGRSLALRHKTNLKIDLSWFEHQYPGDTPRSYELDCFSTAMEFSKPKEIPSFSTGLASRIKKKLLPPEVGFVLGERGHEFNKVFDEAPDNCLLVGFWQSDKYFHNVSAQIRQDFSFVPILDKFNLATAKLIRSCEAVSVHVRRGDYANNQAAKEYHGLAPVNYYRQAIAIIRDSLKNPHFFVFSDDLEWCRKNLQFLDQATFIGHNSGKQSYRDIQLMSLCRHHIVANSSFSWWGAWLNPSLDKIVIAPRVWFKDPGTEDRDVIPDSWTKL